MILSSASPASVVLTVATAAAYAVPAAGHARLSEQAARRALLAAWLLHGLTLAWGLLGDAPRFGFAPAVSMTAWLVLTVYAIERQMFPQLQARWALTALGSLAVLLALAFPGTPMHVATSAWLPLHWALGIAAYGLFAAAVVHAWLMQRAEQTMRRATEPQAGLPLLTLERLTFRFATAGFVLLSATLLAGVFFSEVLYGRAWRWDHKTIFSVLSWAAFALLLLGRARFGWRGRKAVRVIYFGSLLLLLAYVGSRFVLEVLLKASRLMKYLLLIVLVFVAYSLWRNARLRDERGAPPPPAPGPKGDPQEMVSCPVCGVHLPRSEAVPGARGILYCSNEHRLRAGG